MKGTRNLLILLCWLLLVGAGRMVHAESPSNNLSPAVAVKGSAPFPTNCYTADYKVIRGNTGIAYTVISDGKGHIFVLDHTKDLNPDYNECLEDYTRQCRYYSNGYSQPFNAFGPEAVTGTFTNASLFQWMATRQKIEFKQLGEQVIDGRLCTGWCLERIDVYGGMRRTSWWFAKDIGLLARQTEETNWWFIFKLPIFRMDVILQLIKFEPVANGTDALYEALCPKRGRAHIRHAATQTNDPDAYMQQIRKRIRRAWFPPKGEKSKRVVVKFYVHKDGHISDLKVSEGSGMAAADQAALKAVQDAAPFSPLPDTIKDPYEVTLTIDYKLFNGGRARTDEERN